MQLDFLILADSAQVVSGKLYMLGGAWTHMRPTQLPHRQEAALAVGMLVGPEDTDQQHAFVLELRSADNELVRRLGEGEFEVGAPQDMPTRTQRLVVAIPLQLSIQDEGAYRLVWIVDDIEMGNVPFQVIRQGSPPT